MGTKVVSIYQPCYLPPMHYVARIMASDVFVLLDDVQLNRKVGQSRAKVVGPQGWQTLTVPLAGGNRVMLDEVKSDGYKWVRKHVNALKSVYGYKEGTKAKEWIDWLGFRLGYAEKRELLFSPMCDMLLRGVLEYLGWEGKYVIASKDSAVSATRGGDPSDRMLKITQVVGGTSYLCGEVAANEYLDKKSFAQAGVDLLVQDWKPTPYEQRAETFHANASIFDGLVMVPKDELKRMLIDR